MASQIVTDSGVNVAQIDGADKKLLVRPLILPPNWSKIRVGIMWQVNEVAGLAINGDWQLGFCRGQTNCYGDPTTDHYFGIGTNGAQAFGQTGNYYWTGILAPMKRVGVTTTRGTNLAAMGTISYFNTSPPFYRMFYCDVEKGAPNYSFRMFYCSALNATNNFNKNTFKIRFDDQTPNENYHAYAAAQTLAVDEAVDGAVDSAMFYWSGNARLWIHDLMVAVLS